LPALQESSHETLNHLLQFLKLSS